MVWTVPRTYVATEVVTAAILNLDVRDNLNAIAAVGIDGWTDYSGSATWTGTTDPTYTVTQWDYCQIGKLVVGTFTFTQTGTPGTGNYSWSLPVTNQDVSGHVGSGYCLDDNLADRYLVSIELNGSNSLRIHFDSQSADGRLSATVPFTWASSDVISGHIVYEAA